MNLLLDTHTLLWLFHDAPKLSAAVQHAIADPENTIHVSAVSAYEISLKIKIGRLDVNGGAAGLRRQMETKKFAHLGITFAHCEFAGALDYAHRDPFDRILAAQSSLEQMPLVTTDAAFALFGTKTLW